MKIEINRQYFFNLNVNIYVLFSKCIFFEDTIDNLVQAKRFHWTTVLIGNFPNDIKNRYEEIDYVFSTVIQALNFFLSK